MVRLLLAHGARVNFGVPLVVAIQAGRIDIVCVLLKYNPNLNAIYSFDKLSGWCIDSYNMTVCTPLIAAVAVKSVATITLLLDRGADVDALLLDTTNPTVCTSHTSISAYVMACFVLNIDIINLLEPRLTDYKRDLKHAMISLAKVKSVTHRETILNFLLREKGVDINCEIYSTTALMAAIDVGIDVEFINLLMRNGADPNCQDSRGKTALHIFIQYKVVPLPNHGGVNIDILDIIECFLEHKTDVTIRDSDDISVFDLHPPPPEPVHDLLGRYYERNKIDLNILK